MECLTDREASELMHRDTSLWDVNKIWRRGGEEMRRRKDVGERRRGRDEMRMSGGES